MLGNESKLKAWISPAKIAWNSSYKIQNLSLCYPKLNTFTQQELGTHEKLSELCFPNSRYKDSLRKYSHILLVSSHALVLFKTCGTFTQMEKKNRSGLKQKPSHCVLLVD